MLRVGVVVVVFGALVAMAAACAGEEDGPLPTDTATPVDSLKDLGSVNDLRAAFLQDEGSTRLVLLVCPPDPPAQRAPGGSRRRSSISIPMPISRSTRSGSTCSIATVGLGGPRTSSPTPA